MKTKLIFLALLLLVVSLGIGLGRKPQQNATACGFTVQDESVEPTIQGPDELVPLVHVVQQPDSPIEVLSVDLTGMWLSISHEQTTEHFCAKYRVRNRSDRTVQGFELRLSVASSGGAGGSGAVSSSALAPGQSVDVESCNGGGHGSAKDNYVRLLVYVHKVELQDCHYKPSLRLPRSLGVSPVW
jgi:hypothetical protein